MNSSSYRHGRRLRVAAGFFLMLAGLAGSAQAVDFDEQVKAPMMKDAASLRSQAQAFSARFAELQDGATEQLITNRALAGSRLDLIWQIQQAIDLRRPLGEVSELGLVSRGDGSYNIDFNSFPQWERVDRKLAELLPTYQWDLLSQVLTNRGFTAEESSKLKAYLASRDANVEAHQKKLPIALGFSKVVKKYDKIKRPVPESVVLSYIYQLQRAGSEATREWAVGLLDSIGAHGARILLSAMSEGTSTTIWSPSDQPAGIAGTLAAVRQPDFEQQATAQAKGTKP
ncbi:MAG: hypothetical protein WDO72_08940 [Pseudomonadota bacterium]